MVQKIILSRTDSIGDVILTLPMAGILKEMFQNCSIIFLGRDYTRDLVSLSPYVDEFLSWDDILKLESHNGRVQVLRKIKADAIIHVFPQKEIARLAKRAHIKMRIGTSGRFYHYTTCNKLVWFSRKRSKLHEAQLNLKLLHAFGWDEKLSLNKIAIYYGSLKKPQLSVALKSLIDPSRINLILHPKSKGSAREWGLENFQQLINLLDEKKYKIFLTGTESEGEMFRKHITFKGNHCIDVSGKMSLEQLIAFIDHSDGLIAASTGPLHIAAMLGKLAIGIYPPIKPMHPGRWAPVGRKATFLVNQKDCIECRKEGICHCMKDIKPQEVVQIIEDYVGK